MEAKKMKTPKSEITIKSDSFTLRCEKGEYSMPFGDVVVIRAEKADIFSYDLICVIFESAEGEFIEVTEEASGFSDFMEQVLTRFSGSDEHWWEKVVFPAFAPCPTVIWEKEK